MARGASKAVAPHVGIPVGPHIEEYLVPARHDQDGVQVSSGIGQDGKEYPDPVPMSPPVGYVPPNDLMVLLDQIFKRGKHVLEAHEIETEEEANDFEIEDDPLDPLTEYEKVFEPVVPVAAAADGSLAAAGAGAAAAGAGAAEPPPTKASAAPVEPKAGS